MCTIFITHMRNCVIVAGVAPILQLRMCVMVVQVYKAFILLDRVKTSIMMLFTVRTLIFGWLLLFGAKIKIPKIGDHEISFEFVYTISSKWTQTFSIWYPYRKKLTFIQ